MLFTGMLLQGIALIALIWADTMIHFVILSILLGWGTAMVYPTFLATVSENTHPKDRAQSIGIFRLWRDLGYAIGAILTGIIADAFGIPSSMLVIGLLTLLSSMIIKYRMTCPDTNALKLIDWLFRRKPRHNTNRMKCTTSADSAVPKNHTSCKPNTPLSFAS
jgi:MFS family permease